MFLLSANWSDQVTKPSEVGQMPLAIINIQIIDWRLQLVLGEKGKVKEEKREHYLTFLHLGETGGQV